MYIFFCITVYFKITILPNVLRNALALYCCHGYLPSHQALQSLLGVLMYLEDQGDPKMTQSYC